MKPHHIKHDGARAGSRTLNLGIKRRLTCCVRRCQGRSGRVMCIHLQDAFVSRRVTSKAFGAPRALASAGQDGRLSFTAGLRSPFSASS